MIYPEEGHVLTHLGMGDQITCNGLVRELYKRHSKLYVYCKLKYYYTIEAMYKDLKNLYVLPLEEQGAHLFASQHNIKYFYNIGMVPNAPPEITVEKGFYLQAGVDFNKKWENFYVERDFYREIYFFSKFDLKPNEYIFFHDDIPRNQIIKRVDNKNLKIVRALPEYTNNIFDYLSIIENAREIHVIESCFMFLVDLFLQHNFKDKNLVIHRYTKPIQPFEYPTNKLPWKVYV